MNPIYPARNNCIRRTAKRKKGRRHFLQLTRCFSLKPIAELEPSATEDEPSRWTIACSNGYHGRPAPFGNRLAGISLVRPWEASEPTLGPLGARPQGVFGLLHPCFHYAPHDLSRQCLQGSMARAASGQNESAPSHLFRRDRSFGSPRRQSGKER